MGGMKYQYRVENCQGIDGYEKVWIVDGVESEFLGGNAFWILACVAYEC